VCGSAFASNTVAAKASASFTPPATNDKSRIYTCSASVADTTLACNPPRLALKPGATIMKPTIATPDPSARLLSRLGPLLMVCMGGLAAALAASSCTSSEDNTVGDDDAGDGQVRDGSTSEASKDGATTITDSSLQPDSEAGMSADADAGADAATDGAADASVDGEAGIDPCGGPNPVNLVANPGLNTDTTSWDSPSPSIAEVWSSDDALGCTTSGSIGVLNTSDAGINNGTVQCVPVTPGVTYNFGVAVKVPATPAGTPYFMISFRGGANCAVPVLDSPQLTADTALKDQWQFLSGSVVAPVGAVTAQVYLQMVQPIGGGFQPLYDRAYLSPAPAKY
jgi:hypothetical protein